MTDHDDILADEVEVSKPELISLLRMDAKRIEMIKVLNEATFPVIYQPKFYDSLYQQGRDWSWLAHYNMETLVGAICCRLEEKEDNRLYIMTLGVLEPYRQSGIATCLLKTIIEDAKKHPDVKSLALHVQLKNQAVLDFYKKFGFTNKETVQGYYKTLGEDAYLLTLDTTKK